MAIMGGLAVATGLTLLALSAMYAAWFRVNREASEPPSPTILTLIPAPIPGSIPAPTSAST